ncbi:hypothetical protein ACJJIP_20675 [Microbulbifer sp. VTAC004]|uniref:hypothetical protein n=1 Tax=unclassified Microbulbifer TaxID=2619833 RepID=UPI004039AF1D
MGRVKKHYFGNFHLSVLTLIFLVLTVSCTSSKKLINSNWHEIETEHFRIVTNGSPRRVTKLAVDLERFRILTQKYFYQTSDQQKLTIYALADELSFSGMSSVNSSQRSIGQFQNTPYGSFALLNLKGNQYLPGNPARQTLFHEYTHFLTYSGSRRNYPYWFSEGIAEVFSTAEFGKNNEFSIGHIPVSRAISLSRSSELPLEKLLTATPGSLNDRETSALYASGWMLAHWLYFDPERIRAKGLELYLDAYHSGADSASALPKALGMTFEQLNNYYKKLPKSDFGGVKGSLDNDSINILPSTKLMNNNDAVVEIANFMAVTGRSLSELREFVAYAEKKQITSPALNSALAIAAANEKNFILAREILEATPDVYQRETWYLEASAKTALTEMLDQSAEINVKELKYIRDQYIELVNANGNVPAYWHGLAITMQVLGYSRSEYVKILQQAYLRAPRNPQISWWYANELYLNRNREEFPLVVQPLLMQTADQQLRANLKMMVIEIGQEKELPAELASTSNGLGRLLNGYRKLSGNKALAMAMDYRGTFVAGYMEESANQFEANQLALQACEKQKERYQVRDRCAIYAEGEQLVDSTDKVSLF